MDILTQQNIDLLKEQIALDTGRFSFDISDEEVFEEMKRRKDDEREFNNTNVDLSTAATHYLIERGNDL